MLSSAGLPAASAILINIENFSESAKTAFVKFLIPHAKKYNNQFYFPLGLSELEYVDENNVLVKQKFDFAQPVIMTAKERDPENFCLNFMENDKYASGGEADVYLVKWKAELSCDQLLIVNTCYRIVKDIYFKSDKLPKIIDRSNEKLMTFLQEKEIAYRKKVQLEYEFAKLTGLRPKRPVEAKRDDLAHFYLIEAYIPEKDLIHLINEDRKKIFTQARPGMQMTQRLQLARLICERYLELSTLEIVHRDPSIENIRYKKVDNNFKLKLTDFSMAKKASDDDKSQNPRGSFFALSPEAAKRQGTSVQSDKYGVTKIIRLLFSPREMIDYESDDEENKKIDPYVEIEKHAQSGEIYDLLFEGCDHLSVENFGVSIPGKFIAKDPAAFIDYLRNSYSRALNTIFANEEKIKTQYEAIILRREKIIKCLKQLAAYRPENRLPYQDAIALFKQLEWEITYSNLAKAYPELTDKFDAAYRAANECIELTARMRAILPNKAIDRLQRLTQLFAELQSRISEVVDPHPVTVNLFVTTLNCDRLLAIADKATLLLTLSDICERFLNLIKNLQSLRTNKKAIAEIDKIFHRFYEYPFFNLNDLVNLTEKLNKDYTRYCSRFSIFDPKQKLEVVNTDGAPELKV